MKAALALAIALALLAASCGGGPVTVESYLVSVQDGFDQAQSAMEQAVGRFQAIVDDTESTTEAKDAAYLALHRENRAAFETQRRSLSGLEPPENLAPLHREMADGLSGLVAALDASLGSLAQNPTAEDIIAALNAGEVTEANVRVIEACRAYKTAAEEAGIDISLPC